MTLIRGVPSCLFFTSLLTLWLKWVIAKIVLEIENNFNITESFIVMSYFRARISCNVLFRRKCQKMFSVPTSYLLESVRKYFQLLELQYKPVSLEILFFRRSSEIWFDVLYYFQCSVLKMKSLRSLFMYLTKNLKKS